MDPSLAGPVDMAFYPVAEESRLAGLDKVYHLVRNPCLAGLHNRAVRPEVGQFAWHQLALDDLEELRMGHYPLLTENLYHVYWRLPL